MRLDIHNAYQQHEVVSAKKEVLLVFVRRVSLRKIQLAPEGQGRSLLHFAGYRPTQSYSYLVGLQEGVLRNCMETMYL